jgi:hypothetical protein
MHSIPGMPETPPRPDVASPRTSRPRGRAFRLGVSAGAALLAITATLVLMRGEGGTSSSGPIGRPSSSSSVQPSPTPGEDQACIEQAVTSADCEAIAAALAVEVSQLLGQDGGSVNEIERSLEWLHVVPVWRGVWVLGSYDLFDGSWAAASAFEDSSGWSVSHVFLSHPPGAARNFFAYSPISNVLDANGFEIVPPGAIGFASRPVTRVVSVDRYGSIVGTSHPDGEFFAIEMPRSSGQIAFFNRGRLLATQAWVTSADVTPGMEQREFKRVKKPSKALTRRATGFGEDYLTVYPGLGVPFANDAARGTVTALRSLLIPDGWTVVAFSGVFEDRAAQLLAFDFRISDGKGEGLLTLRFLRDDGVYWVESAGFVRRD